MKTDEIIRALRKCPFLADASDEVLRYAAESGGCDTASYSAHGEIYTTADKNPRIGIILSGRASVYSDDDGRQVLLRRLSGGDITGVGNLFSDGNFISRVVACTECEVLFLNQDTFGYILEHDRRVMYDYIAFLTGRIRYLNKKILCLTAGSAERRLALWLDSLGDNDTLTLPVPMNALSDMLGLGRASLYRAFDTLEADGFVKRLGRSITLTRRDEMTEFYN